MTISNHIKKVRQRLRSGELKSESAVSQGIILPALQELGWPVFDTRIVVPEFSIEDRRVDFALCNPPGKPIVFVEVKNIGLAEGADKQLFEYAFHKGVPLAVLTNGKEWNLYLPSGEGNYIERRIYKLDIIEHSIDDLVYYISRYLKYENIKSGEAIEAARKDYQDIAQKRKIEETLPLAWERLLEEKDEILIDLLADKVEDLCGFRPQNDICSNFFSKIKNVSFAIHKKDLNHKKRKTEIQSKKIPNKQEKLDSSNEGYFELSQLITANIKGYKPKKLKIQNEELEVKNWADLSVKFLSWLIKNNYLHFQDLPIINAGKRNKYFVNDKAEHVNSSMNGHWCEINGFFIDTKYNNKTHIRNILATLQQLNIDNLDVKISF